MSDSRDTPEKEEKRVSEESELEDVELRNDAEIKAGTAADVLIDQLLSGKPGDIYTKEIYNEYSKELKDQRNLQGETTDVTPADLQSKIKKTLMEAVHKKRFNDEQYELLFLNASRMGLETKAAAADIDCIRSALLDVLEDKNKLLKNKEQQISDISDEIIKSVRKINNFSETKEIKALANELTNMEEAFHKEKNIAA